MNFTSLVIDEHAVSLLDSAIFEDNWFKDFAIPENTEGLRRVASGSHVYIFSNQATQLSGLLVVAIGPHGVFSSTSKPRVVFERIMRIAMNQFDRNISIPVHWQQFHAGSRLSVYAEPYLRGSEHRICFDRAPCGSANIYAFSVSDKAQVLDQVEIDLAAYQSAMDGLIAALATPISKPVNGGNFGIILNEPLGVTRGSTATLDEWYDRRLNPDQVKFVKQPHDRPIRLRGAAGTGKTQAMAVKCLRDLYQDADAGGDKTFAFLTHSSALAHEILRGMFYALDPSARWQSLVTTDGKKKLWIGTLYEFAQERLEYEKKGLKPLSLDGMEGRDYQRLTIESAIVNVTKDPRIALGLAKECPELFARFADADNYSVIEELMNEFACTLDAENIRKGTHEADKYLRGTRDSWQMSLHSQAERQLVLEIHDAYRTILRGGRFLSMDQMVADLGRYLTTHEWDQLRDRDGFDLIFVDEYHYFTRVEAMIFHNLFKTRAQHSGRWPLIMAYDLKQSTSDVSLGGGIERFKNPGVGESTPVELTTVYRSTPEISAFLQDIDGSYPAIDLEGEYNTYIAKSAKNSGDVPRLLQFDSNIELIDAVFEQARKRARELPDGGTQVAVLCVSEELFEANRSAGRNEGKFVAITSREDLKELRYARSRCIFSMPEFVAGLQFDTVFLIHVDAVDLQANFLSQGAQRRYVSRVYLGASRAMEKLFVACARERGGKSVILNAPIKNKSLTV